MKQLAMIVAASDNDVIGDQNDLPWRLSADLKRFKKLTMGHHIIMGRKTFDSIGRLLPGRTTVILTRQTDFEFAGAKVANSLESAMDVCSSDDKPFVTGGAEIYRLAIPHVTELHLTRVHTQSQGDTRLPKIDWSQWDLTDSVQHAADEKNEFNITFETYVRKS
jgi:dihydrofolate reductase